MRHSATFTGHTAPIYTLAHAGRPGYFLSGAGDGRVVEWNIDRPDSGEVRVTVARPVFAMHVVNDLLLLGNDNGGLHVIDLVQKSERHLFEVHGKGIFRILDLPGARVACAGGDGSMSIWTVGDHTEPLRFLRQIPFMEEKMRGLAVSTDGSTLAVACGDGSIRIVDTVLFNEHHTLTGHANGASCVAFHPEKPVLLSGGKDGHLRLWRADEDYRPLHALPAHAGTVYAIAFDPTGQRFATAGRDKAIKLWDASTLDPLERLDRAAGGHAHSVNTLLWAGGRLLTAGDDRTIRCWAL